MLCSCWRVAAVLRSTGWSAAGDRCTRGVQGCRALPGIQVYRGGYTTRHHSSSLYTVVHRQYVESEAEPKMEIQESEARRSRAEDDGHGVRCQAASYSRGEVGVPHPQLRKDGR